MAAALELDVDSPEGGAVDSSAARSRRYRDRQRDGVRVPRGSLELWPALLEDLWRAGLIELNEAEAEPIPMETIQRVLERAVARIRGQQQANAVTARR